ncbi:hypothetical protein OHS33_22740 [Streptomyces sp. NBC_00536]|uniref:hypothetical protein n=1 Tax=Streptomyces sp. NBC_00536 TaxID=2975769 RepID=UPI002E80B951|nr:hypothetical protein [Streptomyces sp. NBC_00536]WUC80903.1 hypothetical protein OHS33_22740 [Streptomyces sp. NBC_00536]
MKARAAAIASLAPLLLTAAVGCTSAGGTAADGRPGKSPDPKASAASQGTSAHGPASTPAAPSAAPRSGSALEKSALEQGDLVGYQISAQGKNPGAPSGQPQADKKACQPLADVMGDKPDPAARETVDRGVGSQTQSGLAISDSVSSYAESDAKQLIARLKAAVAACGAGFNATIAHQTGSYREVKPVAYQAGGDESVSWTVVAAAQGVSAHVHLVLVRQGSTVVRLMAVNVADAQKKAEVPHDLTDKQIQKIKRTIR